MAAERVFAQEYRANLKQHFLRLGLEYWGYGKSYGKWL